MMVLGRDRMGGRIRSAILRLLAKALNKPDSHSYWVRGTLVNCICEQGAVGKSIPLPDD